jgi:hypothetical protein
MKSDIDWKSLDLALNPPTNRTIDFASASSQFTKVAFDVYKKTGEEGLWELRDGTDGRKVLVALYEESGAETIKTASLNKWSAHADSSRKFVTLAFRDSPICKFAASEYGFDESNAEHFASFVVEKARDSAFVDELIDTLTPARRAHLLDLFGDQGINK